MKKIFIFLIHWMLIPISFAATDCFIVEHNNQIIHQDGNCTLRHTPAFTFKIAISLMGYNEGILIDTKHPEFPYKPGYLDHFGSFPMDAWKKAQNPTTWIQNSCVWYSQLITQKIGREKFRRYINEFQYGNKDVSGDPRKDNGLTNAWLSSSLQVAPKEQVNFLKKLITLKLPVSKKAQNQTMELFFLEELPNGWKLYGKTGTGFKLNSNGKPNFNSQVGWFIGWATKGSESIIFAQYTEDKEKMDSTAGKRVKEIAKEKILKLINTL